MDTIISVIGRQYQQPIADLVGALLKRSPPKSDTVSSAYYEGAYVVSILLLLVGMVESMVARDRYFSDRSLKRNRTPVPEYMKEVYRYRSYARVSELYVVRDAIFHNHVWVLQYLTRTSGNRKLFSATRISWSGDNRLAKRLNPRTFRTKLLGINAIPTKMDRKDLVKVFDVAISTLQFLEQRGANPVKILDKVISLQGVMIPFLKLRQEIANAL